MNIDNDKMKILLKLKDALDWNFEELDLRQMYKLPTAYLHFPTPQLPPKPFNLKRKKQNNESI